MLNQDQLQRNNPKQLCKRFIIYLWSHGTNSNAFLYREKGKKKSSTDNKKSSKDDKKSSTDDKKSSKDDKNSTNSSTEAEQIFQEAGPAPKNKCKTHM